MQRDRPQQPRAGAGREPPPPPRPPPCAPGAPAQPPLPAGGGGTDSRLPNPVSHWYEHRAGNVTRPAATSLPPGCTAGPASPLAPGGTGHPRPGLPRAVSLQPRAAPSPPRPAPGSPPGPSWQRKDGVPVPEGRKGRSCLPCPGQRRCLCVRVPACPRVCAVPAASAACVALQRAGSAAAPAPRAGRGERIPPRHHPLSEPGWRLSLRYSRREPQAGSVS